MLTAIKAPSTKITKVEEKDDGLYLYSEYQTMRLSVKTDKIVRVMVTKDKFDELNKPGVIYTANIKADYTENDNEVILNTGKMTVSVNRITGLLSFYDGDGSLLFNERKAVTFEKYPTYLLNGNKQVTERVHTPDGEKTIIKEAEKVYNGDSYHIHWFPKFSNEALYGLGQHEEGYGSLRGKTLYIHQGNRKIAVPLLTSTKGYGLLLDTYSPLIFNDSVEENYIYNESAKEWDYYFLCGNNMDDVIGCYRLLTGKAAMLPKWAYGYIQSKERYETARDIIDCVKESRNRNLGMDCIVLDWISWEEGKWGQKTFDRSRFEDPKAMIDELHKDNVHFMISVWPTTDASCKNHAEFADKNLLLPASDLYNPFVKEGRETYWNQIKEEILPAGTDAFWCDSAEPITPEWSMRSRPEPSRLFGEYIRESGLRMSDEMSDAYGLFHAMGIYEGQRKDEPSKRVCNLTRSIYTGGQRYGTIMWSGDISASFDTMRKQIGAGLNFCASGMPYWTIDVGAFFVKNGDYWYWNGDFDDAEKDLGYKELYVRWYQWACFLPVFRCHGTDCNRELWAFGDEGDIFYDALVKTNRLRYELMPYIYSEAGKVYLEDGSLIRNLAFLYPNDQKVWDITDQYMFGPSLMVCPVTEPILYGPESTPLNIDNPEKTVYLPAGNDWYDFYSGQKFEGGQYITVPLSIDRIPVFVKEGSIIPMNDFALSVSEQGDEYKYRIFSEKECEYVMYTDAGDGYGYENGEYTLKTLNSAYLN